MVSSVESAIKIFCEIYVLGISELVAGLVEALPVDVVLAVFGFGLVLL